MGMKAEVWGGARCHPLASHAVILSVAKDLPSSVQVLPSSSGQALSGAKDLPWSGSRFDRSRFFVAEPVPTLDGASTTVTKAARFARNDISRGPQNDKKGIYGPVRLSKQ